MELAVFLWLRSFIKSISDEKYKVGLRHTIITFGERNTATLSRTCSWLLYKPQFCRFPNINCVVYKRFLLGSEPPMERHCLHQGKRQLLYAGIHYASDIDWTTLRSGNKPTIPIYPLAGDGRDFNYSHKLDNSAHSVRRQSFQIIMPLPDV